MCMCMCMYSVALGVGQIVASVTRDAVAHCHHVLMVLGVVSLVHDVALR